MRLLLDECVPRPLLRDFAGHDARHVVDMGWSSKRNGELLKLMLGERFEALLTVLRPLLPQIITALATIKPCEFVAVGG